MSATSIQYPGASRTSPEYMSLAAGTALIAAAVKRPCPASSLLAAVGGIFLYHGAFRRGPSVADRRPSFARGVKLRSSVIVNAPAVHCHRFWRDLRNLPLFLSHIHSVEVLSEKRSHWIARPFGDFEVDWDAEIIRDDPPAIIGWRSLPGSRVATAGSIRFFSRGANQTRVVVTMTYNPPAGALGTTLLELFGVAPEQQIAEDLNRFKHLVEEHAALSNLA